MNERCEHGTLECNLCSECIEDAEISDIEFNEKEIEKAKTSELYVTNHALERFAERFGGIDSAKSIEKRSNTIRRVVAFGVKLKPVDSMRLYLSNGCRDMDYLLHRNIIAVVDKDRRVVTVYGYEWDKWEVLK